MPVQAYWPFVRGTAVVPGAAALRALREQAEQLAAECTRALEEKAERQAREGPRVCAAAVAVALAGWQAAAWERLGGPDGAAVAAAAVAAVSGAHAAKASLGHKAELAMHAGSTGWFMIKCSYYYQLSQFQGQIR